MHHQTGVNFENFTEVKFRDILLTGTGHRDKRLNRDSPGQTGTYGRSNLLTSGSFVKDHLLFLLFTKSAAQGIAPRPPCWGPGCISTARALPAFIYQRIAERKYSCFVELVANFRWQDF